MSNFQKKLIISVIVTSLVCMPILSGCGKPKETSDSHYSTSNNDPTPKIGKVLSESLITEENLTHFDSDTGISVSISPLCLDDEDAEFSIREVSIENSDEASWEVYDFSLDANQPFEGIIKIEIPYSSSEVIDGLKPQDCLSGVCYNEEDGKWEELPTSFDTSKKTMTISTTHLTVVGKKSFDPRKISDGVESGTTDIGYKDYKEFDPNAPDFPPFFTMNQGTPDEYITHFDNNYIFDNFMDYFDPVIFRNIEKMTSKEQEDTFYNSTLSFLSGLAGSSEHGTAAAKVAPDLIKGVTSSNWRKLHGSLGHIGAVLSVLQLASDASEGTNNDKAIFTFIKNMVYYQGATAATFVFGEAALPAALVFLAGCYLFEWNISSFEDLIFGEMSSENEFLHKRFMNTYDNFYKRYKTTETPGGKRHFYEWGKKIDQISEEALKQATFQNDYTKCFQNLLIEEIDKYNLEFFELDDNTIENFLTKGDIGAVYGSRVRPHIPDGVSIYAGAKNEIGLTPYYLKGENIPDDLNDNWEKILAAMRQNNSDPEYFPYELKELGSEKNKTFAFYYISELRDQTNIKTGFMKQFLKIKRGDVIEEIINPILEHKRERFETETKIKAIKRFSELKDYYNRRPTFVVSDPNAEDVKSKYAGCVLVPKFPEPKTAKNIEDWFITLDKNGSGEMKMNLVAYFQQLLFDEFNIFDGKDREKIIKGEAKPIGSVSFICDDYNPTIEVLLPSTDSLEGQYEEKIDFAEEVRYNQTKMFAIARSMGDQLTATNTKAEDLIVKLDVDKTNSLNVSFDVSVTLYGPSEDGSFEGYWYLKSNVNSESYKITGTKVDILIPTNMNISEQRIYGDGKNETTDLGTAPTTFKIVGEFEFDNSIKDYVFIGKMLIPESFYFFNEKYGEYHEVELILTKNGTKTSRQRKKLDFEEFNDPKYNLIDTKDDDKLPTGSNPMIPKGGANPFGGQPITP